MPSLMILEPNFSFLNLSHLFLYSCWQNKFTKSKNILFSKFAAYNKTYVKNMIDKDITLFFPINYLKLDIKMVRG